MSPRSVGTLVVSIALVTSAVCAADDSQQHPQHQHHQRAVQETAHGTPPSVANDARTLVTYPPALRAHTLANMRDHLLTLGLIQEALANGAFDEASDLAERRLGMTSLQQHGAHEASKYMPKGMQDAGSAMHHKASRFALVAKDAAVTGDLKAAVSSLAALNRTCVACHAGYRFQ